MTKRFDYVKYDTGAQAIQETFKRMFSEIADYAESVFPESRAKSLCLTKLEEAYMWTGKAIRDQQIMAGGDATHQPERG